MKSFKKYAEQKEIPKANMRIIGDVHGHIDKPSSKGYSYLDLINNSEYSIQVGDLGFDYSALEDIDHEKHVVIGGNHDNYDNLSPHFLGDYGTHKLPNGFEFFYIRGALSVDKHLRLQGRDWWGDEEISYSQGQQAIYAFSEAKPKIVITHDAPTPIIYHKDDDGKPLITNNMKRDRPSKTNTILEQAWEEHKPQLWIFGHHHNDWEKNIEGTTFRCLGELSYLDL